MPEPLQTFRAVEGASPAYTAAVTLASQPFVLHYQTVLNFTASTTTALTNQSLTFETLRATRFLPWTERTEASCYPIRVPNAYDRIFIYPMYYTSTDDLNKANTPNFVLSSYLAPIIMPFGLQPETRGHTTVNKLNPKCYRFPDDVVSAAYPTDIQNYDTRAVGIWNVLPSVDEGSITSNGRLSNSTGTTFGRSEVGVGASYHLPDDFSVSSTTINPISDTNSQKANSTFITGLGTEFRTMGSEEIIVSIGANPSGLTVSNTACTIGSKYRAHFFLMGMFLG